MATAPISNAALRDAATTLAALPERDRAALARVVTEALVAQVELGSLGPAPALVEARALDAGFTLDDETAAAEQPRLPQRILAIVRSGPRSTDERALVSALLAQHIAASIAASPAGDEQHAWLDAHAPALDWLEFCGPYAPYAATHALLDRTQRERFVEALGSAPVRAGSTAAADARRTLRGLDAVAPAVSAASSKTTAPSVANEGSIDAGPTVRDGRVELERAAPLPSLSIAGELAAAHGPLWLRLASVFTGVSVLRGAVRATLRLVFSYRSPATLTLDEGALRVIGHTEVLGRTLRTFDVRVPLDALTEVRREVRYPALPVALGLTALGLGTMLGARAVVEGAGVGYFPLIAIGLGALLLGVVFELLGRALFPGVRGRARLMLRGRDVGALELTDLPSSELERLLDRLDARAGTFARRGASAAVSRAEPPPSSDAPSERVSATTERDAVPEYKPVPMPPMGPRPSGRSRGAQR